MPGPPRPPTSLPPSHETLTHRGLSRFPGHLVLPDWVLPRSGVPLAVRAAPGLDDRLVPDRTPIRGATGRIPTYVPAGRPGDPGRFPFSQRRSPHRPLRGYGPPT